MSEKWEDRAMHELQLPEQSEQTHSSFDELRDFWVAERTVRMELEQQLNRESNACKAMAEALKLVVALFETLADTPEDEDALQQADAALALYRGKSA